MSKRKLLLADDSVTIQKVVNLTFADEGIEVIAVGDGDAAMDKLGEILPDLVMADVNMPGMNGYQICERIKQDENLRQTPVILLVGSFEPFDQEEANRVGADDYLTKPFQSIRQLVNKVTVLLNAEREPRPADSRHLADTLEMKHPQPATVIDTSEPVQFEDVGMDDEMIQTSQVRNYALDESSKFETRESITSEEDLAKTQPLTVAEMRDFEFESLSQATFPTQSDELVGEEAMSSVEAEISESSEDEIVSSETTEEVSKTEDSKIGLFETFETEAAETIEETSETRSEQVEETIAETLAETGENVKETSEIAEAVTEEEVDEPGAVIEETSETVIETPDDAIPMPEVASILQIDESNPLELPPIEYDSEGQENELDEDAETDSEITKSEQISPDLIEAIANRVLEKLTDQTVKEIAWEVIPQQADLIIKKMVEEKLSKE